MLDCLLWCHGNIKIRKSNASEADKCDSQSLDGSEKEVSRKPLQRHTRVLNPAVHTDPEAPTTPHIRQAAAASGPSRKLSVW